MLLKEIDQAVRSTLIELAESRSYRQYRGPYAERLESELQARVGAAGCLLASSGTAGLEIALRAFSIGAGDEVILSAYDYPGNFWAVERVGAMPVLVDTGPDSWRISMDSLRDAVNASGRCKAIIASHLHGQFQQVGQLRQLCEERGMRLIEDSCQSIGAIVEGRPAGSHGHVGIFSFGGGKLLSAGRGGAVVAQDTKTAQRLRLAAGAGSGAYELSELQAAVVLSQLPWLDRINAQCCQYFSAVVHQLHRLQGVPASKGRANWAVPYAQSLAEQASSIYQAGFLWRPDGATLCSSSSPSAGGPSPAGEPDSEHGQVGQGTVAGWEELLYRDAPRSDVLRQHLGRGFSGFHRRSGRRCSIPFPLRHAPLVADNTLVVHHRIALVEEITPAQLAHQLAAAIGIH